MERNGWGLRARGKSHRNEVSRTLALEVDQMESPKAEKGSSLTEMRMVLSKFCWLWALILLLIGIVVAYYLVSQDFDKLALIVLIAVTLIFAFFTYLQAEASRGMAKDLRDAKFASFQPVIVMGLVSSYGEIKNARFVNDQMTISDRTWLHNVGNGPALNLQFFLKEPNRKKPVTIFQGGKLGALPRDDWYELTLLSIRDWKKKGRHDLVVEYDDILGKRWCSGLELDYDAHLDKFAILRHFFEKVEPTKKDSASVKQTQA